MKKILLTSIALNLFVIVLSQSLKLKYDASHPRHLGGAFPIGIEKTDTKGRIKKTKGFLGGKQFWLYYTINVWGGTFYKGNVRITDNPQIITDHKITIIAYYNKNPRIMDKIDVLLTYKGLTIADFTPQTDYIDGLDGDILHVFVKKVYDSIYNGELLMVKINSMIKNDEFVYYIHPKEGSIHIIANGGNGKDGQDGGSGGDGGDAGEVNVFIHENAQDCLPLISISNSPGEAGRGGSSSSGIHGQNGIHGRKGLKPKIEVVPGF